MLISTIIALYWIAWIITFVWYFPTIRDLLKWKPSANLSTYGMRTGTMIVTFLYAMLVNGDIMFIIVVWLQMIACIVILILRLRLEKKN